MAKSNQYDSSSIDVLKGLDPIKERPGMYTETENPNHIAAEIVDNALDEALAGYANTIIVTSYEDGSLSVEDDGRGIPTGIHPTEKRETLEVVFTSLHSGGKFKKSDGGAYSISGGLHGVGVSVTNALSQRLEVRVFRNGQENNIVFAHGEVLEPITRKKLPKELKNKTGTFVKFNPEPKYFDNPKINLNELEKYLKSKAVLLLGKTIIYRRPNKEEIVWCYEDNFSSYLKDESGEDAEWLSDIYYNETFCSNTSGFSDKEGVEVALGWAEFVNKRIKMSYVNLIPTPLGGTHERGLINGVYSAIISFAERLNLIPKNLKLDSDDVCQNLSYILSLKMEDVEFQGQTKTKLNSKPAQKLVSDLVSDNLSLWLNDNPEIATKIIEQAISSAETKAKQNNRNDKKRYDGSIGVLPGKLADCKSNDASKTELFLVEGDSAGGSAKQGRDKNYQAILPLRGKITNTWEIESQKLNSQEVSNISISIGIDPHSYEDIKNVDMSKLRYGKIIIMADADVDGAHIMTLLSALFYKHFPALIYFKHVYVAVPPLFRVEAPPKKGDKEKNKTIRFKYASDEKEKERIIDEYLSEGVNFENIHVGRFKGLGEMNPDQLCDTTMDIRYRKLIRLNIEDHKSETEMFDNIFVKKNSKWRKEWLKESGDLANDN